ncbi:MAG TPA: HlyD family secretion protein [Candidatus Didemnitutus sp.]|nr:HlyD family secretion protein [Candidatus Didemnitutus sp.]
MSTLTEAPKSSAPRSTTAHAPAATIRPHAPADPAAPSKRAAAPAKRNLAKPILFGLVAAGVVGWLAHFAVHAYHYEETDNAYVVGHIHQVGPQLSGQVKEVLVQDNQDVKAGDMLVRLDALEFEIAVQKAQASLAQAQAQETQASAATSQAAAGLAEATARATQADAQIVQARAQLDLAKLTLNRNEQLFKNSGATTQAEVDNARSAFSAAQAGLDAAAANRSAAQASVGSAEASQKAASAQSIAASANVAAAKAAVRDAERQLAYTVIKAPADGRIGNKNVEPGNRVTAGQSLLALAEPAPWIVANFKETQLARMHVGQEVEISVDAIPGQKLRGHIDSLSPASGAQFALLPADNATGNFNKVVQRIPVKIVLDPESLRAVGDRLRLGYSVIAEVRIR